MSASMTPVLDSGDVNVSVSELDQGIPTEGSGEKRKKEKDRSEKRQKKKAKKDQKTKTSANV
jgi:hypothetical protein